MSKNDPNKEFTYGVEEKHRGEWQELLLGKGKPQKIVRITERQAEIMNAQSAYSNLRYVKKEENNKSKKEEPKDEVVDQEELNKVREEYEEVIGKKAFHGWDVETLRQKIAEEQGSEEQVSEETEETKS